MLEAVVEKVRPKIEGPAIRLEGGLLSPDFLDFLSEKDCPGQRPEDFGLPKGAALLEEIAKAYQDAKLYWHRFQQALERLSPDDPATSLTRDRWVIPLLSLLGYEIRWNPQAYEVEGEKFAISHRAGENADAPPVHIAGARQELGRRAPGGPRLSPHALVQEFLNRTEHLWGLVTNGLVLRVLRKTPAVRRQPYLEFDLSAIFEADRFEDFVILFRLLHRSRLPKGLDDAHECWLEKYHRQSTDLGNRARDRLRDGVLEALKILGNGFLSHPKNDALREKVRNGTLPPNLFYQELLRLVYRFLFLFTAEERGILGGNEIYRRGYGLSRLRRLADNRRFYTDHSDLWLSLRVLWQVLRDSSPKVEGKPLASLLGLPVLDGELFTLNVLEEETFLTNRDLLQAVWHLSYFYDPESRVQRRVNYAYLDVEELGSVYESLLEFRPVILTEREPPEFDLLEGTERKSTGSYYTPHELVQELVASALEPVLLERLKAARTKEEKERAILSLKVIDPATGSGHFLLAAARRLGKELARIRTGEEEPAPEALREAVRDVITHCLYGVDKNPLAVELCKVALWIEGHTLGKPLTFLDHRIKCGDSLVGVFDLSVLEKGIPEEAYEPAGDDDKNFARKLRNEIRREERRRESGFFPLFNTGEALRRFAQELEELSALPEDTPADVQRKSALYYELLRDPEIEKLRLACDLWTAAFFARLRPEEASRIPKPLDIQNVLAKGEAGVRGDLLGTVRAMAERLRFFHWPLEFPEVFAQGGFDVVLCNPPWEQIQLEEQEFFASRDPTIANAPNAAARKRLIEQLPHTNPALWQEYRDALHVFSSTRRFLEGSRQYPLTGRGRINTYSVFAERIRLLVKTGGRAGIIVPTGIATDDTNKHFFANLLDCGELVSLFDFENRDGIFPHVHRSYKFCLLTLTRRFRSPVAISNYSVRLSFFSTRAEHLRDPRRVFTLTPDDIARINPNTRTLPVFRTRQDAELTKAIYERVPVLVNEVTGENPWGVSFKQGLFNMSSDSHLFRTREDLERDGFRLVGNRFVRPSPSGRGIKGEGDVYLPLYEAKMIWHYDHRYGTYEGVTSRSSTELPTPSAAQHADPAFLVQPWYWVPAEAVEARLGDWKRAWLLGFRRIARSTDERTAIFTLLPRVGAGDVLPVVLGPQAIEASLLLACSSTIGFDFVVRQKIGGVHLDFHYAKQLPVLSPSAYLSADLLFIVPRVLELVYTAWDMKPFADDVWREADEALREAIRRQWEENAAETGGHPWAPPPWIEAYPEISLTSLRGTEISFPSPHGGEISLPSLRRGEISLPSPRWGEGGGEGGIPFPPFKWDEERRARLRAELDAYYARLYGLTRKQLRYILDPADLTERELADILDPWEEVADPLDPEGYRQRCEKSNFPGETFRVLKEKELRQFGEYRTRRLILEAWQRLEEKGRW
ncbi:N-6 DNA methylase [Candidatus Bipolaricaulota bacterium]|nr:N-6 DNA methylase [Candidatus Bipolaricaulota bacterium]